MICPFCHNEHEDTALFCPNTGQKLVRATHCQNCGNPVQPDWKICGYCGQPVQGWVGPGPVGGGFPPPRPKSSRRWLGCLVGTVLGLLILVAVLLAVDAFTLHGVARLMGDYDGAAAILPADSAVFVSVNFLNATPQKLERLTEPFSRVTYQPGAPRRALVLSAPAQQDGEIDPFNMLLQEIEDDTGLKIPNDLTPWAGQFGGIAIIPAADGSDPFAEPGIVIAVEARSPGKADSFLRQWASNLRERTGAQYTRDNYRGVTIYVPDNDNDLTFARSGWAVLASYSGEALQDAIDSQKAGATLMKEASFKRLLKQAPAGRTATLFLHGEPISELFRYSVPEVLQLSSLLNLDVFNQDTLLALGAANEGLQVDILSAYNQDGPSPVMAEMLDSFRRFSPKAAEYFPQETVFLYNSPSFSLFLDRLVDELFRLEGGSRDEFYDLLQDELGFRLDQDLFNYLDQDWGLGMALSNQVGIELERNLHVEWFLMSGVEDQETAGEAAENLAQLAESAGASIRQKESGGQAYYQLNLPYEDVPLSYGYDREALLFTLGGDMARAQELLDHKQTLAGNPRYRETWRAFPRGMKPLLYLDLEGAAEALGSETIGVIDQYWFLRPVQRIAAAIQVDDDYQTHLRLVTFIEQP